jgi:hypothetical protein
MIEKKEKRAHTVTSPRLNLFINYFNYKFMETIVFDFATEKKAAQAGGGLITGSSSTYKNQTIVISLTAPWYKKDSDGNPTNEQRTKSGALGVITSHGWLNASELLSFMETLSNEEVYGKLISVEKKNNKNILKLNIDPTYSFKLSVDGKGKISKVEA